MEHLETLLIANRGAIAARIARTAKSLNIHTIAIYTATDAAPLHVTEADESVLLSSGDSKGYLDGHEIIKIAKERGANAIIPGYGFLSENANFARAVAAAGMVFVGPSPEAIESFALKHTARELAVKADVPVVLGTKGLIENEADAVSESKKLGFPVMLKATAGGGGMGLLACQNVEELKDSFATVKSRGETLFENAGVFIEKYYPNYHHIEVQILGNGLGDVIHFGVRECSIQRRHQKIIEECPGPFVTKYPELREKLGAAAVRLAESIKYSSVGTIEYLVDDESKEWFFLEMNTRLQVEHGITELCYNIDLVKLMLEQANCQLMGSGGISKSALKGLHVATPNGAAIECRVYAGNPARDYAPSPGTLQAVEWAEMKDSRIDTWVHTGTKVTSNYDPLLAKAMFHSPTRSNTIRDMRELLYQSRILGPPTNLDFLGAILENEQFVAGNTLTNFLSTFKYSPAAIDVLSGGAYTQIQDYPGRPSMGRGFPQSGPMDPLAFQIANALVGNPLGKEGLEITLTGPELLFLGPAIVAICGAPIDIKLDGESMPMWSRIYIKAGQKLNIGKTTGGGCRSYMAIHGGFPTVPMWFTSKSTSPGLGVGGYQGRQLLAGDFLDILNAFSKGLSKPLSVPGSLIPEYSNHWDILAMVGPYDEGYLLDEDFEMIYSTKWQISHNAARGGIRLIGPKPKWARKDGGDGGAHPSNVIEYGYPIGALNWTGDDPCVFPVDCPDLGGFVSSTTIIKADYWRLGQMKAGDTMQFRRVTLSDAYETRKKVNHFIRSVAAACYGNSGFEGIKPLDYSELPASAENDIYNKAVIYRIKAKGNQPLTTYRQGADDYVLVDYGKGSFDLNHRCRVTALIKALKGTLGRLSEGLIKTVGCGNSLLIYYDGFAIPQANLIARLIGLEAKLGDLSKAKVPSRIFKLPITFDSRRQDAAIKRYQETQRPYASYLPDNIDFVAKNNGISRNDLESLFLNRKLIAVSVGFFAALPLCLPVDPRQRINCPKYNPSRVFTPEGQVSWGGSCLAIYNVESPGGYQLTGLTIPCVDMLGSKAGYSLSRPWLFEDFDQLTFYKVSEEEYERQLSTFHSGRYVYQAEECEFDMEEHNKLLVDTAQEVKEVKAKQRKAQAEMEKYEAELMEKWIVEKAAGKIPMDKIEALLNDPAISKVESPLNANVWKVIAKEGDKLEANGVVVILEAMKLEISVRAEDHLAGGRAEKLLVKPGEVVKAGDPILLVRIG
ncbi:MAG: hypothetical protein MMC33_007244 [Icmadophila ericetorum]|nr:hypothetical protein [Icmadophila ericetorum]